LKAEGTVVDEIPAGYEIYENPNGQVFLRKKRKPIFTDDELNLVRAQVEKRANVGDFLIDVRDKAIVIYTADQDVGGLVDTFSSLGLSSRKQARETVSHYLSYSPMMRFVLHDADERTVYAERYCFLGSIDDWIGLSAPGPLQKLVPECVYHLGRDSFYDLY
jgi:hypothetical protein